MMISAMKELTAIGFYKPFIYGFFVDISKEESSLNYLNKNKYPDRFVKTFDQ